MCAVVFISNYYTHHQADLSYQFSCLTNGEYWFIQTEEMSEERKQLGWEV